MSEMKKVSDAANQMGHDTEITDEQVTVYVHGGCLIVYLDDDDWVVESCWDEMWVAEPDSDPTATHSRSIDVDDVLVVLRDLLSETRA
jgi:hypothetical protein